MLNKEIPFRPKLEGNFRIRFYNAASQIKEDTSIAEIDFIIKEEIIWVEDICTYNLEQRKKYRAIWLFFRDLVHSSWKACYRDGVLYLSCPTLEGMSSQDDSSQETKKILKNWMSDSRHERLLTHTEFIKRMERPNASGHSILDLIADGNELADRLVKVKDGSIDVKDAVKPYLQLITEDAKDEFTGLRLGDIWSYFRLTWSNPSEPTPGRNLQYLIRDAAQPMHAVMGISSLENCTVQITCRDNYIGWNRQAFVNNIIKMDSQGAKSEFRKLLNYIEDGIEGIDYSELCSKSVIERPTEEDISCLFEIASRAEKQREDFLQETQQNGYEDHEKSELGSITKETEKALYRRKRAEQLARMLSAKKALLKIYEADDFEDIWRDFCESEEGESAIRTALIAQKTKHIGSSLMELTTCGAIPPYNEILGGKLVALLALSPQVVHDYKEKYSSKASMIASRLKGEPVYRPADLVYVGTTSLYYVGSSQYNRLKLPKELFSSKKDVVWEKLGMTVGYGTMQISKATTASLKEATSNGFNRINHVFGEGASPKMRLVSMALDELLETTSDDTDKLTKHAMPRIVYGACLAENTIEYLLGKDQTPEYYTDMSDYVTSTQKIIDFWSTRWLQSRLNYNPVYQRIRDFHKENLLVGSEIEKDDGWNFLELTEVANMPANNDHKIGLQYIRDFYRGKSAYADYVDPDLLTKIHIRTKLDDAIVKIVKSGKDVVLTGNPGDGKTHIIRILSKQLESLDRPVRIELDASTLSNAEIYGHWKDACEKGIPFVIAINAAVLYAVYRSHPDFEPLRSAYNQMIHSVTFHDEIEPTDKVVVFDLSKRSVLTQEILHQAIGNLTDDQYYMECHDCPFYADCVAMKNRTLLRNELFQQRLCIVLQRVSLRGYHATLRELQSMISYLIFGDRNCKQLNRTTGNSKYDITNLIYSGKGRLFKEMSEAFDPVDISHPIWDEKLLQNDIAPSTWVKDFMISSEAIEYDNLEQFQLRKRQFFFFNRSGDELLDILDDDVERFRSFLQYSDSKMIRELMDMLNRFFGSTSGPGNVFQVWSGHRFNNEPRKILISAVSLKKNDFRIGRPFLLPSMNEGIDMAANYVRLEKKDSSGIFLRIDFNMFCLLQEAERGAPVLFMETDLVKKVWRFVEQLQSCSKLKEDEDIDISLMDVQNKNMITVSIDGEDEKYSSISCIKKQGELNKK